MKLKLKRIQKKKNEKKKNAKKKQDIKKLALKNRESKNQDFRNRRSRKPEYDNLEYDSPEPYEHEPEEREYDRRINTGFNHEIAGILFIALGILLFLSFYFENSIGLFGGYIKRILLGLLGIPAFMIPPLIMAYALLVITRKDGTGLTRRMIYALTLLMLVSSLLQTGFYRSEDYLNLDVFECIARFYNDGNRIKGGGVLGGIISMPFLISFKTLGTIIILTALSMINIILLTNISFINFIKNLQGLPGKKRIKTDYAAYGTDMAESGGLSAADEIDEDGDTYHDMSGKSRILNFKIEKTTRNIKGKAGARSGTADAKRSFNAEKTEIQDACKNQDNNEEPLELIMKDVKKNIGSEVSKMKKDAGTKPIHHDMQDEGYICPSADFLEDNVENGKNIKIYKNAAVEGAKKLEETLGSFGVDAKVINISRGPTVTRYELQPSPGVKVSRIVSLSDDISLNLASAGVRIEAPIPGKAAIGIEVPNKEVTLVLLKEVIDTPEFIKYPSKLAFAIGKDISGEIVVADIAKMPHLLIAGATGAGKSVCINNLIISLLYKASPDEVKLLMIDPKVVELGIYNGIPHLLVPVVTDPKKASGALNWAVQEMINRYKLFAAKGVRDLKGYNAVLAESKEQPALPQIVIIIDELADLMMAAPNEVEDAVCRLAQMARAAGMHLVIATQRPSVDVITGVIKANIPSRISFAVTSQVDSRTILDMGGAEKLLGKGDMLLHPVGRAKPVRVQGAFVSEKEIERVVNFVKSQGNADYDVDIIEEINSESDQFQNNAGDNDELLSQAIDLVVDAGQASVSLIQRRFKVGYARAARIIDQMEARGIVGGFEGSKPRQVLITKQQWQELKMADYE